MLKVSTNGVGVDPKNRNSKCKAVTVTRLHCCTSFLSHSASELQKHGCGCVSCLPAPNISVFSHRDTAAVTV